MKSAHTLLLSLLSLLFVVACSPGAIGEEAHAVPAPKLDAPLAAKHGTQTAVLAGGCFWGLQWVFEHVNGVTNVTSG